ncbi:MAG TPA: hypothetical protein VFB82_13660, partial [Blastocatellia bacterium]|nr:hypothetical protein [Blastocatellia bacterium]
MNPSTPQRITVLLGVLCAVMLCGPPMLTTGALSSMRNQMSDGLAGNRKLILLRRGVIDTEARVDLDSSTSDRAAHANSLQAMTSGATKLTRIVQFAGPLKRKWIGALTATGAEIIGYVPNYAYIVRGPAPEIARVAELDRGTNADETHPIRWMARLLPIQKIDPVYTDEMLDDGRGTSVEVEIELTNSPGAAASIEMINKSALIVNCAPRRFGKFEVLSVTVDASRMLEIASLEDVLFIGPAFQPRL